ncbi:MAG: hypothetical protein LIO62_04025, partial [Clostridiales bacterium]|nr:hypothetical protein [Clostridiales bacterium]
IMVTLKNIKKTDEYIEANYIPEDSNEIGYLKVDLKNLTVIDKKLTSFDTPFKAYMSMAKNGLERLKDDPKIPEKYIVMWY